SQCSIQEVTLLPLETQSEQWEVSPAVAALTMIDLSFLSEEEQEAILSVLKRDAELKKSEQQRVQKLQQTVSNKEQLKYLTGEWFYETKQLRHQDSIHGSDIIRASIKHTYKPMTIYEPVGLDDGVEVGSEVRPPTVISLDSLSLHALSPRLRKKLFGIFRRQKEKKPTVQKEEEKQKKPGQTQISNSDAADTNAAKPATVQHEANYHEKAEVRMLPLTALQKTTFIEAMEAGAQQEVTEDESQEEAKQEDISKKGREVPQGLQTNITSVDNKTTITTTLSSQTVCDSSSKDGDTYRVSGSMSSIYPTDYGDIEVQGNIQFAMSYIQKLGEFHIFVVHCQDLAVGDTKKSRTDPYVKCYLLPEKTDLGKKKTTVKKKTFNPEYNEVLRFKVNKEVLKTQNLNVSVWHNDTFGRNSFLGEVELDLSEWDFNNTRINEYMLKSRVRLSFLQQKIVMTFTHLLSLLFRCQTETGEVQIWVKDFLTTSQSASPLLVCSTVLPDTSKKSRQKTRVVKRTANPMFNHTMVYDGFRSEDLREACVEITVWDHDRLNSQFIGGLRLGLGTGKSYGLNAIWMDSTAAEANLWQRMLESDGEWVEDLLPLRMFGIAKCI
uniref:Synaptotagmin like 2 n=1 Tax=Cynoglossus semilaevis TaxID=244447 RepID=A0A3P8WU53_CYNSE